MLNILERACAGAGAGGAGARPQVLAVARRKGVTLLTMVAFDMWGSAGFLGKVFAPFGEQGVSVDLIATSQYAVSVTLDHIPDGVRGEPLRRVVASLERHCSVDVRHPCAVVSVVGRALRNALPQLGRAMQCLQGVTCHMLSEASEDLNMSFVVDEAHADRLVADLHAQLLEGADGGADAVGAEAGDAGLFGPAWTELPCGKTA
jgi:diaminopimelate decarboxylase/aspartate kinase